MHLKKNYRTIDLAQNLKNKTAKLVQHLAINCQQANLMSALADLCNNFLLNILVAVYGGDGRSIVFTQTKADANQLILTDKIKQDIEVMHGDIAQNQREVTLKRFREGKFNVLVATDVASRGLDIPNVDLVIQVEPPNDVETYIHRSGRTARAGREGTCITFYDKKNQYMIQQIEQHAGIVFKMIGVPQPEDVIRASSKVMLKNLDQCHKDVLPLFKEAAQALIENSDGDPEKALCKALAYISGYYKNALQSRSLITGVERQTTLEMKSLEGKWDNPVRSAVEMLGKHFPSNLADNVRGIKGRHDQLGVVFDIFSDQCERFLELSAHLKETDSSTPFEIVKCTYLPKLEDDESRSAWRSGGQSNSYGGKHGRHQSFNGAGGGSFKSTQEEGWGGSQSQSYKPSPGKGGFHSRQQSGTGGAWNNNNQNNGAKSYQNSRKASGFSNWDQQSNNGSEAYGDDGGFDDINININHGNTSIPGRQQPSKQHSFQVNNHQNLQEVTKVFVQDIHYSVREDDLREAFTDEGLKVVKVQILKDQKGQSKGIGFVEFGSAKDATTAVNKMDGFQFSRQSMKLEFAKPSGAKF